MNGHDDELWEAAYGGPQTDDEWQRAQADDEALYDSQMERECDDDATLYEGQNYNWMREYGERN